MTATASRSSLVSAANNSSMFPSYFFVSVLYHYLCYYSIYKMHKKVCLRWRFMKTPFFHHKTITTSDIIKFKFGRDIRYEDKGL